MQSCFADRLWFGPNFTVFFMAGRHGGPEFGAEPLSMCFGADLWVEFTPCDISQANFPLQTLNSERWDFLKFDDVIGPCFVFFIVDGNFLWY